LPVQLLAVALAESGFDKRTRARIDRPRASPRGSGSSCRALPSVGLEVSPNRDERSIPPGTGRRGRAARSTASALRRLAVAIARTTEGRAPSLRWCETKTPNEARSRLLGSNTEFGRYLASVLACVILTENPELMD